MIDVNEIDMIIAHLNDPHQVIDLSDDDIEIIVEALERMRDTYGV